MLRIGKNAKDQEDNDHSNQRPEVPDYSTPKTYPSYQTTSAEMKPAEATTTTGGSTRGAMTESETLARDIKEGTLSGFVGGGTVVTGEANFKAMMRVDGHLSGRVSSSSGTLIVGANGKVDANIEVAVAIIHGTINGDIIATQRLELGRAAKVNGNIQTPSLVIEQGAVFEGSCKMVQMTAAADKAKRDNKPEPLDTSRMKPIPADAGAKPTEIPAATNVVN
jgi:cytoskeletal protein CcmA (bactofilin family)